MSVFLPQSSATWWGSPTSTLIGGCWRRCWETSQVSSPKGSQTPLRNEPLALHPKWIKGVCELYCYWCDSRLFGLGFGNAVPATGVLGPLLHALLSLVTLLALHWQS